jgi:hypothetical protein
LAAAGAFIHLSSGDWLAPMQPKLVRHPTANQC